MESEVKYDMSKLINFAEGLSKRYVVKLGVFAEKATRKNPSGPNNPTIAATHEFGSASKGIPRRSFLRMPLDVKQAQILKTAAKGAVAYIAAGNTLPVLKNLGYACEEAIEEAFQTGGFGRWAKDKYETVMHKLRKKKGRDVLFRKQLAAEVLEEGAMHVMPLIDTGQLRRSITSKVA